jgi:hypothetical protein
MLEHQPQSRHRNTRQRVLDALNEEKVSVDGGGWSGMTLSLLVASVHAGMRRDGWEERDLLHRSTIRNAAQKAAGVEQWVERSGEGGRVEMWFALKGDRR